MRDLLRGGDGRRHPYYGPAQTAPCSYGRSGQPDRLLTPHRPAQVKWPQTRDFRRVTTTRNRSESAMAYVTEQNLTDIVLDRWQQIPDPRLRQVMQAATNDLPG